MAALLVLKAEGDESILDKLLDDPDVPDEALGFHMQQSVEKRLKAVLALHEIEYERTHSLSYLTALLEHHGIAPPQCRDQLEELTPWAVVARYDDTSDVTLDRAAAHALVSQLRSWSQDALAEDTQADAADGQAVEPGPPDRTT